MSKVTVYDLKKRKAFKLLLSDNKGYDSYKGYRYINNPDYWYEYKLK